jgi:phospholipid N-methyltransferase
LELSLSKRTDIYANLVSRLKEGDTYADVGCCLGQDIRKLIYDGVPAENLVGLELNPGFIDAGYKLFKDKETLRTKMVRADIQDPEGSWTEFQGQMDVVQLGMIMHLFSWDQQVTLLENAMKLLKLDKKGTCIIGQAAGHMDGILSPTFRPETFRHNPDTFEKLMAEVAAKTGTQWRTKATIDNSLSIHKRKKWDVAKAIRISFEVERL